MVRGPGHGTCLDLEDDFVEADEVDMIITSQLSTFVFNGARRFALKWNLALGQFNLESVFVEDLEEAGADDTMNFVCRANDREGSWVL